MDKQCTCGCCEGISVETPIQVYNRPSLTAISYRIGTHSSFKESLLARLSTSDKKALRRLTSRNDDDFTIALLDSWAVVSDVLTFYQERIANESYLKTATEQLSVLELARLIGYELRPGVAASTHLAFIIEDTSSNTQAAISGIPSVSNEPDLIKLEKGVKVQSVPGKDEKPQMFETIEEIEAKAEWNEMRPRMSQLQTDILNQSKLYFEGTSNNLTIGDILLLTDDDEKALKKIIKIELDDDLNHTIVHFELTDQINTVYFANNDTPNSFSYDLPKTDLTYGLVTNYLTTPQRQEDLRFNAEMQGWRYSEISENIRFQRAEAAKSFKDGVFVFRKSASVFGYNAPKLVTETDEGHPKPAYDWVDWNLLNTDKSNIIYLDNVYKEVVVGSYIAIQKSESFSESKIKKVTGVEVTSRTDYGISSKTTKLTIEDGTNWRGGGDKLTSIRSITIHAQSEALLLAELPITDDIPAGQDSIVLSDFYIELTKGKKVVLSGERTDLTGTKASELKTIKDLHTEDGFTKIIFEEPMVHSYLRSSVSINANITLATHGETVSEILGSGDASVPFQKFTLKQPPLTYTSSTSPSGTESTLEIRVNDILWKEVSSLYARGANERIYITRLDSEGQTDVIFGDGINGSRLPTGQQNISATYRKGIGAEGMLKSYQLSQLMTRPLGVKGVTNPFYSSGAQDRENLEDARANANLTIFTLGRIVSVQDYEDFARAFAGITKARAIWSRIGNKKGIHITVAGVNGDAVEDGSDLSTNLKNAIRDASISGVTVKVDSYKRKYFRVEGGIKIHADYLPDKVLDIVQQILKTTFSFGKRNFGQRVMLSELITVIQKVEGVVFVDIDKLYIIEEQSSSLNPILEAKVSQPGAEEPLPAELLTIQIQPGDLIALT